MTPKLGKIFYTSSIPNDSEFKCNFIGGCDPITPYNSKYDIIWFKGTGKRDRFKDMSTQDLNGNELVIGDKILICTEKDYGWLGYAHIIGESKLTWRIKLVENSYNQIRNFDKNPKRIIKYNES